MFRQVLMISAGSKNYGYVYHPRGFDMRQIAGLICVLLSMLALPLAAIAGESIRFIAETPGSIVISVEVPEPVFTPAGDDAAGVSCTLDGFSTYHEIGMPAVVERTVMAAIPPGARVELSVDVHASQDYSAIQLVPVPELVSDSMTGGSSRMQFMSDQAVYQRDVYFPGQPAAIAGTGILRGMHCAQILITPVQYNPVQRMLRVARRMTITLEFHGADASAGFNAMPAKNLQLGTPRVYEAIRAASVINPDSHSAKISYVQSTAPVHALISGEMDSSPFAIRVVTSEPGIYRIRYEDIAGLGVDMSALTNSNLKVENLGREIAVYRSGAGPFTDGDFILFYAEDFQSEYSASNVYWLYQGTGDGLAVQNSASAPAGGYPQPDSFMTSARIEQDLVWRRNLPDYVDGEDQWFWLLFNITGVKTLDMPFTLNNFDNDTGSFDIELYMRGETSFNHRTRLVLNGTQIDDFEWTGTAIERRTVSGISSTLFNTGLNTLTVQALTASGIVPTDKYYVNWAELTYARPYIADNNRLAFGVDAAGNTTFEVGGFSGPGIMVFDVSQPAAPVQLTETSIITEDNVSRVRFEANVEQSSVFYAATLDSSLTPDALVVDTPSDLRSSRTDIDYIIIAHNQFLADAEDLKTIREQGGLGVEIVDIQDIYDEFSYGIKDLTAIKYFLRYAYDNWHATDHPTYVVLVGDATYDYRDNLGRASEGKADLIPTYLGYRGSIGPSVGATASDNWFVCVDGDDPLPDMVIGRLCVKQNDDLKNIIDKIITYEGIEDEPWHRRIIFAVDDDDQDIFENMAQSLREKLPADFTIRNLYLSTYPAVPEATADLIDEISNGALITNYIGHGSTDTWSNSRWFQTPNQNTGTTRDDVAALANVDKYIFAIILNCLSGTFSEVADDYSMAEEFLRQQDKGAVACAAASASGLPSHHKALGIQIYDGLFNNNITAAGALLTAAKIEAYQQTNSRDLLETFIFFGDPALELKVATLEPECETDNECADDDLFCTGDPQCTNGVCAQTGNPCGGDTPVCNEAVDRCVECIADSDCGGASTCSNNECIAQCALVIKYKPPVSAKLKKDKKLSLRITGGEGFDPSGTIDTAPFVQVKEPKVNSKKGFIKVRVLVPAGTAPGTYQISVGDCLGEIQVL